MEYKPTGSEPNVTIPLSDDEVSAMLKANGITPTDPKMGAAPKVEDCYIKGDPPGDGYCPADTLLADVGFDLGHIAYSSLINTPEGLPGRGFYLWDKANAIGDCCDSLTVSLNEYRPYNTQEVKFGDAYSNYIPTGLCDELNYIATFDITLLRSCRPIFENEGRDFSSSAKRNAHGYNMMVDARTMVCCVTACLSNERIGGIDFDKDFFIGRTTISGQSHCSSVSFQVGLNLPGCCPDGNYAGLLQKLDKD